MIKSISSSSRFSGVRVKSVRRRRRNRTKSKVIPINDERTFSTVYAPSKSYQSTSMINTVKTNSTESSRLADTDISSQQKKKPIKYKELHSNTTTQTTETVQFPDPPKHCAGISPNSLWQIDTNTTIVMNINTAECAFTETPLYFVSMAGTGMHFCLTGYDAIYSPTQQSFQIYARFTCNSLNGTQLLNDAQSNGWDANWMGFYL